MKAWKVKLCFEDVDDHAFPGCFGLRFELWLFFDAHERDEAILMAARWLRDRFGPVVGVTVNEWTPQIEVEQLEP